VTSQIHLLAISGSLRLVSSNTTLLQTAIALAPENVEIKLYQGLADLPHFNPDNEDPEPPAVTELKRQLQWADGLIISTPEYAHGVPGTLKNALDWLVSSFEFPGTPIALFNPSPRSIHAQAALIEIVTTMSAQVIPAASVTVELRGRNLDAAGIVSDNEIANLIKLGIEEFVSAIKSVKQNE
jgi:chromate reductase, NAD(P)H dehydrogenase (quinone)